MNRQFPQRITTITLAALLATSSLALVTPVAWTQAVAPAAPSPYLLGDADGSRAQGKERGGTHDLLWTNYYQGASGSGADDMEFGGRADLYLNVDTDKLWNWKGGGIASHVEYRYGSGSFGQGGAFLPSNTASVLPLGNKGKLIVTSLHVVQRFSKATLLTGKINAVDLLASSPMLGGRGLDGFSNIELAAPVSGVVPPVIFGAIVVLPGSPNWTFMVFDPSDQTDKTGLESPFSNGVNLGVTASWPANFTRHGGSQSFGVTASTARGTDLADVAEIAAPTPGGTIGTKRGKYVFSYQIEQLLNPAWGVFAKVSKADANPNVHDYSYQLGLGGKGLFAGRTADRFGLDYYRFAFSRVLRDAIQPVIAIRPESGLEAFYVFQVTPGLSVTGDLQWVTPARVGRDRIFLPGIRVLARF